MADTKRKSPPASAVPSAKRKKGGNNGKWRTAHQNEVAAAHVERGTVEPGDVGIWVTCARSMENKAAREVTALFEKYAETMYGAQLEDASEAATAAEGGRASASNTGTAAAAAAAAGADDNNNDDDIEAMIQKELAEMKRAPAAQSRLFSRIRLGMECVLFVKTQPPVDPVALAHRISVDTKREAEAAAAATDAALRDGTEAPRSVRACRYVNRLTPVSVTGRAVKAGVEAVARQVLAPYFQLVSQSAAEAAAEVAAEDDDNKTDGTQDDAVTTDAAPLAARDSSGDAETANKPRYSFAIRPSIRRHDKLDRLEVIEQVAALIDQTHHKVNLKSPDKVILIEICTSTCGMSVVDGDWDDLRKYNLSELYNIQHKHKE